MGNGIYNSSDDGLPTGAYVEAAPTVKDALVLNWDAAVPNAGAFGGMISGTNLGTGGAVGDSFGLIALSSGDSANLNSATIDYLPAVVVENYTANGAGISVGNYGTGDGIYVQTTGTASGTSFALNVFAGDPTHQAAVGTGVNVQRYGTGHAILVTGETGSGAATLVEVDQSASGASLFLNDIGDATDNTVNITLGAKTSGNAINIYQANTTMTGSLLTANVGNGGSFNGTFLDFQKAGTTVTYVDNAGQVVGSGLKSIADPSGMAAGQFGLGVTNGLGNGASTSLSAPAIGTGSGPGTLAVNTWIRATNGTTQGWVPFFV